MGLKKGGLKARGDEGALRFQLKKAKAVYGMKLCGMEKTAFDNDGLSSLENGFNRVQSIKKGLDNFIQALPIH